MKRLGLIFVIVFALICGNAQAEPFTPELEADYAAGLAYWEVSSPPQCASVTFEVLPTDPFSAQDGVQASARATQPNPGEVEVACHLWVFADREQSGCAEEMIIRHEVGHLTGHGHSTDPESIMAPDINMSVWCPQMNPSEATTMTPAQEAEIREAEHLAERQRGWAIYHREQQACHRLPRDMPRARRACWTELRRALSFFRSI